nr:sulfotransferase [Pleurocapsa sp. PCC 7319]
MPNFLIIGAAKAGTTALYHSLKVHPQIYMSPVKEPKFFAFEGVQVDWQGPGDQEAFSNYITDIKDYHKLFEEVSHEIAIGEASPWYICSPRAAERIQYHIPDVKLIAILRDPADRAYSQFLHLVRNGREVLTDFTQALQEEEYRVSKNWGWTWQYRNRGFYYNQLKPYFDRFNHDQIKVYLYEDWNADPINILKDIFQFIGVEENFVPNISSRHNVSVIPKNKYLHNVLTKPNLLKSILKPLIPNGIRYDLINRLKSQNLTKPPLLPQVRKQLIQVYREDILKLQDLIHRDLSKWLQ